MAWGINPNASKREKIKAEMNDYLMGKTVSEKSHMKHIQKCMIFLWSCLIRCMH